MARHARPADLPQIWALARAALHRDRAAGVEGTTRGRVIRVGDLALGGVYRLGGHTFSDDPDAVRLRDFRFRINERFLYEYDWGCE